MSAEQTHPPFGRFLGAALLAALVLPAGGSAIDGSERKRAVNHAAVEFAKALQEEDQPEACRWTVDELRNRCDSLPTVVAGCASGPNGPPPPTPARTPERQIGRIEFVDVRAKARLRPEERGEPGRAWLIFRHLEGRWRIEHARYRVRRFNHPYDGRIFNKFFLGFCVTGDYRE